MTAMVLILGCIAAMFAIYGVRGNPGRAVADTALLVILIGLPNIKRKREEAFQEA